MREVRFFLSSQCRGQLCKIQKQVILIYSFRSQSTLWEEVVPGRTRGVSGMLIVLFTDLDAGYKGVLSL